MSRATRVPAAVRLAGLELRRFTRHRLTTAALVVLAVIPLLYGALYLYAFWDPYGRLNHIPAALVVEDRPVPTADGATVHAGADIAAELRRRQVFGWQVTDQTQAQRGLDDGRYHIVLRIPAEFSAALAAAPDPDQAPRQARLSVWTNDATNYLSGQFARTAFEEVRASAAATSAAGYFDRMLIAFTDLKTETAKAADGAGRVHDGIAGSGQGAGRITAGIDQAHTSTGRLAEGAGTLATRTDQLAAGLATLDTAAGQLADGTSRTAAKVRSAATTVDGAADVIAPLLRDNAARLERSARTIAIGADALAANLDALPRVAGTAVARALAVQQQLDALVREYPELAGTPAVGTARQAADQALDAARQVQSTLDTAQLQAIRAGLREAAANARAVAAAAPRLAGDIANARRQVHQLADTLDRLATGAGRLHQGIGSASTGATSINAGQFRLATGVRQLDGGLAQLEGGGARLVAGLADLQSGAGDLASGLADGAGRIPGYSQTAERADVLGNPVSLGRTTEHPAQTYGVAFAPYFLALALWVGAMVSYMVLRPLNRRHVMSGAPAHRVALAGWLPAVAVGLAQAGLLFAVVTLVLGLRPVHPAATLLIMVLAAAAFSAVVQFLGAALGPAGRIAALALLMLQLTSSGGTYPVQTTPGFFQAIHPYLPMTYVVGALRHAIDGGSPGTVVTGAAVLAGIAAVAVLATVGVARRSRRLTPSKLHPALVI